MSPDGRRLVFHSNRTDPSTFDVWTMRAAPEGPDNRAVDLTAGLRAPGSDLPSQERRPSWSPDGRRIGFHWFTDVPAPCTGCTDGEVYSMRADGSDVRNETANNPVGGARPGTPYADITPDWGRIARRR